MFVTQGSHSITDRKIQDFPGPHEKFSKTLDIKKKPFHLLLTPVLPPLPFP